LSQLSALRLDAEAHTDQIRLLANERERLDKESGDLALQRETLLRDMEGMERTIYDLRTNLGEEQRTSQSYQTQLEEAREHLEKVEADNARLRAGLEETAGLLAAQKDESREHEAEWQVKRKRVIFPPRQHCHFMFHQMYSFYHQNGLAI
jgi:chromosome segregation ATPase